MKKKLFSKLLMGAVLLLAVGSFESCKDYDDDINSLQSDVNTLKGQITTLQSALDQAKSAAAAAQTTANQAVADATAAKGTANEALTTANAAKALAEAAATKAQVEALETTIKNLQTLVNSKVDQSVYDAKVTEIAGQIDAIDTKLNQLTKGLADETTARENGDKALQESIAAAKADLQNQIDVLNAFKKSIEETELPALKKQVSDINDAIAKLTSRLDTVEGDVKSLKTTMEQAQKDIQNVRAELNVLNVYVDKMLTSLVLQPKLYYGGIEAVEAQHAMYRPLKYLTDYDGVDNGAQISYAFDERKTDLTYITPVIDVKYHLNPTTVEAEQIKSLKLLTDDKTYITRTAKAESEIGEVNKLRLVDFKNDGKFFELENGDMHIVLNNSDSAWHKMEPYNDQITVFALEAEAVSKDGATTRTVTSDYGVLAKVQVSNFKIADNDPTIRHYNSYPYINDRANTYCQMMDAQQQAGVWAGHNWTEDHTDIVHIYNQAPLAIQNLYTHELAYNGEIDLDKVIEIHADHTFRTTGNQTSTGAATGKTYDYTIDNLDKYGFERRYTLIRYKFQNPNGISETGESYEHALIKADGHTLMAKSFYGTEEDPKVNQNSIGREPLVRVELIDKKNGNALVAVGFVKFRIVGAEQKIEPITIVAGDSVAFAQAKGDTIMTKWDLIENKILGELNMSKTDFERTYALAGNNITNTPLAQLGGTLGPDNRTWANGGVASTNQPGSVYLRAYNNSWVSANEQLNRILHFAPGYVDEGRYGEFIWSVDDAAASHTNLLAWKLTAQQMKQILVKRDHEGRYLNLDGEFVNNIDNAAYNDYADVEVAARFVDVKNGGNRDVIVIFGARIYQLTAAMNRTSVEWYAKNAHTKGNYEIHANIDAYKNGTGPWNASHLVYDFQNALKTQSWTPSKWNHSNAFDFDFETAIKAMDANKPANELAYAVKIDASKLQNIAPRKLFFFIPDLEATAIVDRGEIFEGTPYWHNTATQKTTNISNVTGAQADRNKDQFYANKYMIKVAYSANPLVIGDTLRTSPNSATVRYDVRHGNQLLAYIYKEATKKFDYNNPQLIASITGETVTYNYNSEWARDLINVAGYESTTKRNLDKQMTAHLGLKIKESGWNNDNSATVEVPVKFYNKRAGEVAVDFEAFDIKFIRPLNLNIANANGVTDATTGTVTATVTWAAQRPNGAPYDWRLYQNPARDADWIGWYTNNNTTSNTWNASNILPDLDHMTTDYSGSWDYVQIAMQNLIANGYFTWANTPDANGNVEQTTFTYINNNTNVLKFDVRVPITLKYWWGELRTLPDGNPMFVTISFNKTQGQ
jgi:archaellum component FlaC/outer membrane murein-binding lipoprotein Lpp